MQGKESIKFVRCELKIPSFEMTVRHHSESLVMPNSYPRDGIFNSHPTIIKVICVPIPFGVFGQDVEFNFIIYIRKKKTLSTSNLPTQKYEILYHAYHYPS